MWPIVKWWMSENLGTGGSWLYWNYPIKVSKDIQVSKSDDSTFNTNDHFFLCKTHLSLGSGDTSASCFFLLALQCLHQSLESSPSPVIIWILVVLRILSFYTYPKYDSESQMYLFSPHSLSELQTWVFSSLMTIFPVCLTVILKPIFLKFSFLSSLPCRCSTPSSSSSVTGSTTYKVLKPD